MRKLILLTGLISITTANAEVFIPPQGMLCPVYIYGQQTGNCKISPENAEKYWGPRGTSLSMSMPLIFCQAVANLPGGAKVMGYPMAIMKGNCAKISNPDFEWINVTLSISPGGNYNTPPKVDYSLTVAAIDVPGNKWQKLTTPGGDVASCVSGNPSDCPLKIDN